MGVVCELDSVLFLFVLSFFVFFGWDLAGSVFGVGFSLVLFGEFDPGSGRTLAACLTHASRTGSLSSFLVGLVRVANG